jgi:hypothetical protein
MKEAAESKKHAPMSPEKSMCGYTTDHRNMVFVFHLDEVTCNRCKDGIDNLSPEAVIKILNEGWGVRKADALAMVKEFLADVLGRARALAKTTAMKAEQITITAMSLEDKVEWMSKEENITRTTI